MARGFGITTSVADKTESDGLEGYYYDMDLS